MKNNVAFADEEVIEPLNLDAGERTESGLALIGRGGGGGRGRGRRGRGRHRDRVSSRSLSEMSVRGLDLLRYATLAPDGTYRCIECERLQMAKNFKNKYSCKLLLPIYFYLKFC